MLHVMYVELDRFVVVVAASCEKCETIGMTACETGACMCNVYFVCFVPMRNSICLRSLNVSACSLCTALSMRKWFLFGNFHLLDNGSVVTITNIIAAATADPDDDDDDDRRCESWARQCHRCVCFFHCFIHLSIQFYQWVPFFSLSLSQIAVAIASDGFRTEKRVEKLFVRCAVGGFVWISICQSNGMQSVYVSSDTESLCFNRVNRFELISVCPKFIRHTIVYIAHTRFRFEEMTIAMTWWLPFDFIAFNHSSFIYSSFSPPHVTVVNAIKSY